MTDKHAIYGWALDKNNNPIPASAAQWGQKYTCPVCGGRVRVQSAGNNRYYFAHTACTPQKAARAIAGRWIAGELRNRVAAKKSLELSLLDKNGQSHQVNLLEGITTIAEKPVNEPVLNEIQLLDTQNKLHSAIMFDMNVRPLHETLSRYVRNGTAVFVLYTDKISSGAMPLQAMLAESRIFGHWWLLKQSDLLPPEIVMEIDKIRQILQTIIGQSPRRFSGELHQEGPVSHVLTWQQYKLWLPYHIWNAAVGGTRHKLPRGLTITMQKWNQPDGGIVLLSYIELNNTSAVALRYFEPREERLAVLDLNGLNYQRPGMTALDLARHFASVNTTLMY